MYRQVLDGIAVNNLVKLPNIPDYHLMVGSAECLAPLPLIIDNMSGIPNEIVQNMHDLSEMSNEDIKQSIENNELEINDFNWNMALIGSGLGV